MRTDRWGGQRGQRLALLRAAILACGVALSAAAHAATQIPPARDFSEDGRAAHASRRVIVVLFSTSGCPWCQRVREEYLKPMLANPADGARIIVREVDIDGRESIADFSGAATTHAEFAGRHEVRFAPSVLILGPRGEQLAAPLVGFGTADYYGFYLDERIEAGLARLNGR
jgi:thiol-disulfide isomerase/thioredoxin